MEHQKNFKALADTVAEALEVARQNAFQQYEAQLQVELGVADLAALTLDDPSLSDVCATVPTRRQTNSSRWTGGILPITRPAMRWSRTSWAFG